MHKLPHSPGILLTLLIGLLFFPGYPWAEENPLDETLDTAIEAKQQLLQEQATEIDKIESELTAWRVQEPTRSAELLENDVEQAELDQAKLLVETRKVKLKSIGLDITAAEQRKKELEKAIQELNDRLQTLAATAETDTASITITEQTIAQQRTLLNLERKHIKQLERRKKLAKQRVTQAEEWLIEIREAFLGQQESILQLSLQEMQRQVGEKRQHWEATAAALRTQLNQWSDESTAPQAQRDLLETQLLEAEESIFIESNQLTLTQFLVRLERLDAVRLEQIPDLHSLKASSEELEQLQSQLASLEALLQSKLNLLMQRQEVISKRRELDSGGSKEYVRSSDILKKLLDAFQDQAAESGQLAQLVKKRVQETDAVYLVQKKKSLTQRHRLPNTLENWDSLLKEVYSFPGMLLQTSRNTLFSLWTALQQVDITSGSVLLLLSLAWAGLCLSLVRFRRMQQPNQEDDFTHKASFVVAKLLQGNRFGLLLSGVLIIAAWLLDIVPPGPAVIVSIVGIWLGARITIDLSHWILKSPVGLPAQQPGLHRLIVSFTALASISSLGLAFGHMGLLSSELTDLVERAFMLLLLPPAYLALRIRALLMETVRDSKGKAYWVRLLGLTGFAIPLATLASAVLGISGYINLGWAVAAHLGLFLLVLTGWLIARGLVIDLARSSEDFLAQRSKRSAFWIKSLVEPLQFLARLILLLAAIWILFRLLGGDPVTGLDFKSWLNYSVFTIGETSITSRNLLGSLFLVVLVFYIGRWAREVTYGWLYGNIKDLGIRNSLSVFTQYAVVVIGLIIALNILGINLTSLTVFAGALGVGIGFGLQNIANNFISGLILLAERPVRSRDWVTIGDKEGEVSQIGMRSVTVTTWDNQDVIIPNSDLVSSAFINWTRSNNVVRTVLFIGIHYQADPHQAQKVIEEAVTMNPAVSLTPTPKIWLSDFGPSSVDFRVHYYMDVKQFSRLEVKSQVLFAIWDALRDAGIDIPYPQQDVYIKEIPAVGSHPLVGTPPDTVS
ncbi:MAG: mechanosensitive ion channel domain-containing protein [Pseudomonadota bacterium]